MVFESIVADVLNRFLGDYVENLDRSQLKIGIWGGDVVLQNLSLKENALSDLDLPIRTVAGRLGKLTLKIPWKNIYTAPVIAKIECMDLLAVPNSDVVYNAEREEKAKNEAKKKELERIEAAKLKEKEKDKETPTEDTFTEKLIAQIIKNLQVKVVDIHVRYEDSFTNPSRPYAFGVTLHDLSFDTTDDKWNLGNAEDTGKFIFKLITLDSLSFYWNSNCVLYSKLAPADCQAAFQKDIATSRFRPTDVSYILGPINSSAHLRLNPKPESDGSNYTEAKILLAVDMEEITLSLSRLQYQDVMELLQALERISAASLHRKYRPTVPVKGHAKQWWRFAYKCVVEDGVGRRKQNWSWQNMILHRSACREYKDLYRQKLLNKKLADDVTKRIEVLEGELDVFNITMARKQAEVEYARLGIKEKDDCGWIGSWFSWGKQKKADDTGIVNQFEKAMTSDEKSKLYSAIGYQENSAPTAYPITFVENQVGFRLRHLAVLVKDDTLRDPEVITFGLDDVRVKFEMRPSAQAIKLISTVGSLQASGLKIKDISPVIVRSLTQSAGKDDALLDILVETNPMDRSCDQRVHITARPLEVIYHAESINRLVDIFKPPESVALTGLQEAARSTLQDFKELSATGLQHAIAEHKVLDLNVNFNASYVIIPENGNYDSKGHVLVADLGCLQMFSVSKDPSSPTLQKLAKEGSTETERLTEMLDQSYDNFMVKLTGVQVILAGPGDNWQEARNQEKTPLHLLRPTNVNVELQKCIFMDDPRLPKMKIKGSLPSFNVIISDVNLLRLAAIGLSIPTPQADVPVDLAEAQIEDKIAVVVDKGFSDSRAIKNLTKAESSVGAADASSESVSNVQVTNVELLFEIGEMGMTIVQQKSGVDDELLSFAVLQLGLSFRQRSYDMTADVYIGGLTLQHSHFQNVEGGPLYVVRTPMTEGSEEKLFTMTYLNADAKGPEFTSTYRSICQLLQVRFSRLGVVLHQEAILDMMSFAESLQLKIEALQKRLTPEDPNAHRKLRRSSTRSTSSFMDFAKEVSASKQRVKKAADDVIDIQIDAALDTFSVVVSNSKCEIANISIKGLEASITVQKSMTTIDTSLRNIIVRDPSPDALYSNILSIVGSDAFKAKISSYNNATSGSGYLNEEASDMSIGVAIGCIQVVFLNKFVTELLGFVNNFQVAKEKAIEASAAAAVAARQNMQSAYEKASRVLLHFHMKAPVIVIPRNSRSNHVLVADLGIVTLKNRFSIGSGSVLTVTKRPVILDLITIRLENLKLSRAIFDPVLSTNETECCLLQPITFTLNVVRNLTASYYKDIPEIDVSGKLAAISLVVTQEDYSTVMLVLNENLSEGQLVAPPSPPPPPATNNETAMQSVSAVLPVILEDEGPTEEKIYTKVKFHFEMECLKIQLHLGSSFLEERLPEKRLARSLATFELSKLAVAGQMQSDNSLEAKVFLVNCILDDSRPSRVGLLTRLMERKAVVAVNGGGYRNMIDVTFNQKSNGDKSIGVNIVSFTLVLSVDYLMSLANFVAVDEESGVTTTAHPVKTDSRKKAKKLQEPATLPPTTKTELKLRLDQPDIILLEDMSDPNSLGVVLNNEVDLAVMINPEKMMVSVLLTKLQLLTYCCNSQDWADLGAEILSPTSISVMLNAPTGQGMKIDVNVGDIIVHISPSTIRLLTAISSSFAVNPAVQEQSAEPVVEDYSELWQVKPWKNEGFWFITTEVAEEALDSLEEVVDVVQVVDRHDLMILEMKTVIVTLEAGVGTRTVPMMLLELSLSGQIYDWSTLLRIESGLSVEAAYYNEKLAIWEPLIEPVEGKNTERRSWELIVEMHKNEEFADTLPDDDIEEIHFQMAEMSVNVISQDNLELTVTKTALEVISNLGKAFGEAVSKKVEAKMELPPSPYKVQNDTGLTITLLFGDKDFQLFDKNADEISEVVLERNASVALALRQMDQQFKKNVGKSVLREQESKEEHVLMLRLNEMNVIRELYVTRANKRYFQLPHRTYPGDQWGLVADVSANYGYKTIALRSLVQVYNHLSVPVEVYYMMDRGNEVQFCGDAQPKSTLNLPLNAVYTPTNELFFRPKDKGHTISIVPFVWKELLKDPNLRKVLQCNPRESNGGVLPFFMNAIGEIEQVYFENSQKKTIASTCYVIHLHPTAVLCNLLPVPIAYTLKGTNEELLLKSGDTAELLTAEINTSYIVLTIVNYQGQNWGCCKRLAVPMEEVWTFEAVDQKKATLDLGAHIQYDGGFVHVSIYCPFWMMNKTGLQLSYRPNLKCTLLSKLKKCMLADTQNDYASNEGARSTIKSCCCCCFYCCQRTKKVEKNNSSQGSPSKDGSAKRRQSSLSLSDVTDDSGNVVVHPPDHIEPVLFSFRPKVFFSKKKVNLRVEGSDWSDKFSLDTVGSSGTVICNTKNGISYEVGVQINLSGLGLSKIVVFSPFYLLVNKASYNVDVCETQSDNEWLSVPAGQCVPFWPKYQNKRKEIVLRVAGTREATKGFSYKSMHSVLLSLDNSRGGLYVDCYVAEASTIVTVDGYTDGLAAVRLVNHCSAQSIDFHQCGRRDIHTLQPGEFQLYTWDDPSAADREFVWSCAGKEEQKNSLVVDGIGEYEISTVVCIYWVSFLDDIQRVLLFTDDLALATTAQCAGELERADQEVNVNFHRIGLSLVDDCLKKEVIYLALTSSGIVWEFSKLNGRRYKPFNVKECQVLESAFQKYEMEAKLNKKSKKRQVLEGKLEVDFSEGTMFRPQHRRIRRIFQSGFWTQFKSSPHQLQLHTKINRLQIDNQLEDAVFPTVLAPVPIPKSVAADTAPKPFTEASIILRRNEHSSVQQFKYLKVLIQEFHVKVDQGFINAVIALFTPEKPKETNKVEYMELDLKTAHTELSEMMAIAASQGQKNFYDVLHISPLKVHISFSMQGGGGSSSDDSKKPTQIHSDFINLLLQSVGVTLTEINDVVFKLGFFEREHIFMTQQQLTSEVVSHYTAQAVKQLYVLVLGLDVIGNPFGLVTGLGKGVEDLFYEPFQGAIQGPEEFAEGLALGVKSLFGHAVGGAAGVASRIGGTLGKGLAALTLDDEYQRKRREALNRRPANIHEGLAQSGKNLFMGVYDGVTGVFVKPLEGAKEEGVEGFFKGVGKGAIGVVVRPTSGLIDFASGAFDAVKRAAESNEETQRVRPPRYFHPDGIMRAYNLYEAEGNRLLRELEKGKFAVTDHYVAHANVTQDGKSVCIVTENRVIMVSKGDIFGQWNCDWHITWGELKEQPRVTEKGLHFMLKESKKKVLGLFGSSHSGRIINFRSQEVSHWILDKIELARKKSS